VQWLIDQGVDIAASNSFGATALMQSAHYGGPTHLLTPHLTPEQVNQRNVFNWTAFTWAGKGGHAASAKALFEAGGDIEAKNMKGSTPLLEASTGQYEKNGNEDIVPMLINLGADVTVRSEDGDTPLHNAAYLGRSPYLALTLREKRNPWLREMFFPGLAHQLGGSQCPSAPLPLPHSLVSWTAGFINAMKLLIEKGADVNALNNANESPIYNAAKGGDPEAIQLLLDAGADPNIPQKDGRRPIHEAARWGKDWAVTLYLEHGADVNVQDNEGSTPLHEAVLWGKAWDDADVPELLVEVR
jgi:ankyrin repeat protein